MDLIPELGEREETLIQRYRGKKLSLILSDLEDRLGRKLPDDFERVYRAHVEQLFSQALQATPGTHAMLTSLPYPRCVASSGPLPKIRQALAVTGLAAYFEDHLFSSYDIGSWKPDPGLFRYAAQAMGFPPSDCIVIEDSEVGVDAALAAGMRVLRYDAGRKTETPQQCPTFSRMVDLPGILKAMHES